MTLHTTYPNDIQILRPHSTVHLLEDESTQALHRLCKKDVCGVHFIMEFSQESMWQLYCSTRLNNPACLLRKDRVHVDVVHADLLASG